MRMYYVLHRTVTPTAKLVLTDRGQDTVTFCVGHTAPWARRHSYFRQSSVR